MMIIQKKFNSFEKNFNHFFNFGNSGDRILQKNMQYCSK